MDAAEADQRSRTARCSTSAAARSSPAPGRHSASSPTRATSPAPPRCWAWARSMSIDARSLYMLGMHGSAYANYAVQESRLPDRRRRSLRRSRHRQPRKLRPQRQDHPHRHRSIERSARTWTSTSPWSATPRMSLEAMLAAHRASRPQGMVRPDQGVEEAISVQVFRRQQTRQAAVRDRRNQPPDQRRRDHHHRRRPASDVGGAVLSLAPSPPDDHLRRPGHDGLRPAQRHRRTARLAGQNRHRHRRRRIVSS